MCLILNIQNVIHIQNAFVASKSQDLNYYDQGGVYIIYKGIKSTLGNEHARMNRQSATRAPYDSLSFRLITPQNAQNLALSLSC